MLTLLMPAASVLSPLPDWPPEPSPELAFLLLLVHVFLPRTEALRASQTPGRRSAVEVMVALPWTVLSLGSRTLGQALASSSWIEGGGIDILFKVTAQEHVAARLEPG